VSFSEHYCRTLIPGNPIRWGGRGLHRKGPACRDREPRKAAQEGPKVRWVAVKP